ncbi:MAG TPA: hypothetical protein DCF45_00800 [Gammaproteobacteria bacterium]|nr:hypothetical protein [Gammaproteobacteria bacterium]
MAHIALHFLLPALVLLPGLTYARCSRRRRVDRTRYLVMIATMVVDLDHLLATPIYDPLRCSIGFHPLHDKLALSAYMLCCLIAPLRWAGVGLLLHMALDSVDCRLNLGVWAVW